MKVGFSKSFYNGMIMAFASSETLNKSTADKKHGTGKHYETITVRRKDGTVYQRRQEVGRKKTENKGRQKKEAEEKKPSRYAGNTGDVIAFKTRDNFNGERTIDGAKVVGIGENGVTAVLNGVQYRVPNADIKEKQMNADGTIPADKFSADNYKKQFTDPNCTNDAAGIEYVYSLLGADGKETQAMVEKRLNEQTHRMKNGDTQIRNMHDIVYDENGKFKSGEWNAEREKLHNDIIAKILTPEKVKACKPKNGEKPKFVMFGGRGGSGKSWFTDKKRAAAEGRQVMFDSDNYLILDADEIKKEIPEFKGWNAGEVHEESSYLNKKIKSMAMSLGLNIIIDGTMNYSSKKPDKVKDEMLDAKSKGYSLEAHYMFTPIQKSCVNAMNRFKTENGDYSGRLVPTDILLGMQDNEKSFDSVKDIVDDWSFRDNQEFKAKIISQKGLK